MCTPAVFSDHFFVLKDATQRVASFFDKGIIPMYNDIIVFSLSALAPIDRWTVAENRIM